VNLAQRFFSILCVSITASAIAAGPAPKFGIDDVLVEVGQLPAADEARSTFSLRASPYVLWRPAPAWELRAGLRLDALRETGRGPGFSHENAELTDTYVRYRAGPMRLTAGLQTIVWGRVDEIPAIDRVSRMDVTRFLLDELSERRRPLAALRWEQSFEQTSLDLVVLPSFRGAATPGRRSVWSPIDDQTGNIIGIDTPPSLAAFALAADVRRDDGGSGGVALRVKRTGDGGPDLGLTMARTRQSLPYYVPDLTRMALRESHPYNRFLAVDIESAGDAATWRSELGMTWDLPVTSPGGLALQGRSIDWIGGVEFFPGGEDTRVSLQLAARALSTPGPVLELTRYAALGGEVETTLDQGRWKLGLRFNVGLNVHDVYLAPRVSFVGWEPHELFATYHHFNGEQRTLGGFHRDHGMLAVGVKTRF
jgi:hypothetical protein